MVVIDCYVRPNEHPTAIDDVLLPPIHWNSGLIQLLLMIWQKRRSWLRKHQCPGRATQPKTASTATTWCRITATRNRRRQRRPTTRLPSACRLTRWRVFSRTSSAACWSSRWINAAVTSYAPSSSSSTTTTLTQPRQVGYRISSHLSLKFPSFSGFCGSTNPRIIVICHRMSLIFRAAVLGPPSYFMFDSGQRSNSFLDVAVRDIVVWNDILIMRQHIRFIYVSINSLMSMW